MPDVMKHDDAESWDSDEKTWDKHIGEQFALMPPALYRIDHIVIKATEWFLVAAGVLFPIAGVLMSPILAGVAMSFSSVSVIGNALRLRRVRLD